MNVVDVILPGRVELCLSDRQHDFVIVFIVTMLSEVILLKPGGSLPLFMGPCVSRWVEMGVLVCEITLRLNYPIYLYKLT